MSDLKSCLYRGTVTHRRLIPFKHRLAYRVFMMLLDLDEVKDLDSGSFWFGYNRFALFSFHDADHGARDKKRACKDWVEEKLSQAGIDCSNGSIRVFCFPRILGYVFNPISIFFCYNRDNKLCAVLYEVKNTFGEQHTYLFRVPDPCPQPIEQACDKAFYVSPFIAMKAFYHFRLTPPADTFSLVIRQSIEAGEMLVAGWAGQRQAWSNKALLSCFWRYPLLTLKIITAIHWHGLRIFLKGATFHRRPPLPPNPISVIHHD